MNPYTRFATMVDAKAAQKVVNTAKAAFKGPTLPAATDWICEAFFRGMEFAKAQVKQVEREVSFNSTREVAIDRAYKWNPDMASCPRGCKLQLLGAGGVPSYAIYSGDKFWIKWAPMPSN